MRRVSSWLLFQSLLVEIVARWQLDQRVDDAVHHSHWQTDSRTDTSTGQHGGHQAFVNTNPTWQHRYQASKVGDCVGQNHRTKINSLAKGDIDGVDGQNFGQICQKGVPEWLLQ